MAKKSSPQQLGSVLDGVIKRMGIEHQLDAARTIEAWAIVAGPQILSVTETAWVRGSALFVKIASPTWRHTLHMQRRDWCMKLNQELGKDLVREIVFR